MAMHKRRRWLWFLVAGYIAIIIGLSSIPGSSVPQIGVSHFDKVIHCVEYAALGFLFCAATGAKRYAAILVGVLAGCLGFFDEAYQSFTPGRDSSPLDACADVLGGGIGGAVWLLFRARWLTGRNDLHSTDNGSATKL